MPEMLISAWVSEQVEATGKEPLPIRHNTLPSMYGCSQTLQRIFGFALSTIVARSLREEPEILIQGSVDGDQAQFIIREVKQSDPSKPLHSADSEEAPVMIGAMSRLISRSSGQLTRAGGGDEMEMNELVFRIPADPAARVRDAAGDADAGTAVAA